MESRQVFPHYVGATGRAITVTLTDGSAPLDLSSEDITVLLWAEHGGVQKIAGEEMTKDVTGTEEGGELGALSYLASEDEIDVAGDYVAAFEIVDDSGADPVSDWSEEFIIRVRTTVKSRHAVEEEEE